MSRSKIQPRYFINSSLSLIVLLLLAVSGRAQVVDSPAAVLANLLRGNERFVAGKLQAHDYLAERPQLEREQHPYAIILACADSRVSPEIIFDESLGKLFVVRTAGHVVDPVALGSIEYAVEHLHVGQLFVLGHESCGAVKATLSGEPASPNIKLLLGRIKPAVDKVRAEGVAESNLLKAAVKENVRYQMQESIFESEVLADVVLHKKLSIAGGVYSLHTGRVELVVTDLAVERSGSVQGIAQPGAATESVAPSEAHEKPAENMPGKPAEAEREKPAESKEKAVQTSAAKAPNLAKGVRLAYERNLDVVVRKTTLMRDEHDRCATEDCRKIAAGETVKLESPLVLNVMGRPQLKIRYKGKPYFILAEADAIAFVGY